MENFLIFLIFIPLFWTILKTLRRIERLLLAIGVPHKAEFLIMKYGKLRKVTHMFLKISQKLPVTVAFKDKFGNPAAVDGKPAWSLDSTLATLTVADDGLSAVLVPGGVVGSFKVQVSADADLGEGVKSILGELAVELLPGDASVVELVPGTPEDQA